MLPKFLHKTVFKIYFRMEVLFLKNKFPPPPEIKDNERFEYN